MNTIANTEPTTIALPLKNGAISVFAVPAGIPLGQAFDELSILVGSARDAIESETMADQSGEPSAHWSAMHNLQLAHALLQAMHSGYIEHRRATEVTP
jgi:hypothetical protein